MNSEDTKALCKCGCGRLAPIAPHNDSTRGWVKGYPLDFLRGHHKRKPESSHYKVDEITGCWVWQLGVGGDGYGLLNNTRASRLYYTKHKGKIPEGLQIDHLCFNIRCVNPDHLEAVTSVVNAQRCRNRKLNE